MEEHGKDKNSGNLDIRISGYPDRLMLNMKKFMCREIWIYHNIRIFREIKINMMTFLYR